jgi:xanthine/CO dehydrogenase XdhC/CoxF family maturation factor
MKELLPDIDRWRSRGEKVALATVVSTRLSSQRPVG